MAYKIQAVNLKDEVYKLVCKERHYSQCTPEQLLKELGEDNVKFEGGRSYEQLSQILSQLIQENKIWLIVTNLIGGATIPVASFESVEKAKRGLENFHGKKVVAKTARIVKQRVGKDFWSHELHDGERIGYYRTSGGIVMWLGSDQENKRKVGA